MVSFFGDLYSACLCGGIQRATVSGWETYADCRILSMPLGPSVLFTRSPTAMAPTKADRRAFSPFSSVVPSSKICVGLKDDYRTRLGQRSKVARLCRGGMV